MSSIPEDQLIGQKEASLILGFKTNQQVSKYIKEGILKTYPKKGSKRNWFDPEEVENLPTPLPVPPPDHYFPTLKANERRKKKRLTIRFDLLAIRTAFKIFDYFF